MKYGATLILVLLLMLSGCSESEYNAMLKPSLVERYLQLDANDLTFSANASSRTAYVYSSANTPWRITNSASWLSASPTSGSSDEMVTFSAAENTSGEKSRTTVGYLDSNVSDWKYHMPFNATQYAATSKIRVESSYVYLTAAEQTYTLPVSANVSWNCSTTASWMSVKASADGNSVIISVKENTGSSSRTGSLTVKATSLNLSSTVSVMQYAPTLTSSSTTLSFTPAVGVYTLSIYSDLAWTASTSSDWIDISPASGNVGTSSVKIAVTENGSKSERSGTVEFSAGLNKKVSVKVNQEGLYVTSSVATMNFDSYGGTQEFPVSSNVDWKVIKGSGYDWITVSPTSGNGNKNIDVTATENNSTLDRTGYFSVWSTDEVDKYEAKVVQKGKVISIDNTNLAFSDEASTLTVNIKSDGRWTVKNTTDWITVSPTSGSGDASLSVSVAENTGKDERTGTFEVDMAEAVETITVTQSGKYFTVDKSDLAIGSVGGTLNITISSNDKWQAAVVDSPDWISLSATEGSGNVDVDVVMADNPSMNDRLATVEFTTNSGYTVAVIVKQAARYLTVSASKLSFFSVASTSAPVTIDTDGKYSITKSGDWMAIAQDGDSFVVSAEENLTGTERSGKVTVALTDLKDETYEKEIVVCQYPRGGLFTTGHYNDDSDYDSGESSADISVGGHDADSNWDDGTSAFTITVVKYTSDSDYDGGSSGATVGKDGYGSDANNDNGTGAGSVGKDGYGSDTNNDNGTGTGTVGKDDYGSDINNDSGTGIGSVGKTDYGSDADNDSGTDSATINKGNYGDDADYNDVE
jgi:hypothetical protein